MELHVVKYQ